jgi:exopolysaccharide biosynthesis protein
VHYTPRQGYTLDQWRAALPQAVVIANANFFSPELTIQGLLVSDGVVHGTSYQGRGGMFGVQNGVPFVRSLNAEPYFGEPLEQAAQAFPLLVHQGAQANTNASQTQRSRRTLIGQTTDGQIIVMATPLWGLGLYDLSAYLPTTDMQLWNAFNLDGGGSTMLYIAATDTRIPSFDAVPAVIAAYPR